MNRFIIALALVVAGGCLSAGAFAVPSYYTHGHGDVRAYYEAGELKLRYQLDHNAVVDGTGVGAFETGPESFGLSDLVVFIPDIPLELPPELLPEFGFIGAAAGAPLWYVPEVQEPDRPWLGFSTEELARDDWEGPAELGYGAVTLELLGVSGPAGGHFSSFQIGPAGEPILQFATSDGIDAADVYKVGGLSTPLLPTDIHVHTYWLFTEPGVYDVTLKFSGTHITDSYKEAIGTVRFAVAVPEPAGLALVLAGLAVIAGARNCRRSAVPRIVYCVAALGTLLLSEDAQAAHLDIVPYFETTESDGYQFSVGRFDFNKTGQPLDGLPPAAIERNVLVFTGGFSERPWDGQIVNGDPGWDLPPDIAEYEDFGAEYPTGALPPRGGRLKFNVVADLRLGRNLSYWDGTGAPSFGPVPDGEILDIYMPAFAGTPASVTLDGANASLPGFELTTSTLNPGSFHTHTGHVLWGDSSRTVSPIDPPMQGFYLFSLNMEIEGGLLFPNYPDFTGIVSGIHAVSPTFHVILAHGFANGDDEYIYGDPLYDYLYDENGDVVANENGDPVLVPILDDQGNPILDVLGVGGFILAPEMQMAARWVHENLAAVPEPSSLVGVFVVIAGGCTFRIRRFVS